MDNDFFHLQTINKKFITSLCLPGDVSKKYLTNLQKKTYKYTNCVNQFIFKSVLHNSRANFCETIPSQLLPRFLVREFSFYNNFLIIFNNTKNCIIPFSFFLYFRHFLLMSINVRKKIKRKTLSTHKKKKGRKKLSW